MSEATPQNDNAGETFMFGLVQCRRLLLQIGSEAFVR